MRHAEKNGFTLIELLVAIGVVVTLMTISFPVYRGLVNSGKKKTAASEIQLFALKLNDFRLEYGFLPKADFIQGTPPVSSREPGVYEADPTAESYLRAGRVLFLALTGRATYDDFESEERAFFTPHRKKVGSPDQGPKGEGVFPGDRNTYENTPFGSGSYLVDPWGNAYGYHYDPDNRKWKSFHSPSTFDIWSTGGGTGPEPKNRRQWVTSW